MSSEKSVLVDIDQRGVAFVTLNRPKIHNAFNEEMIAELTQTFDDLASDSKARVIVLKGNGKSFCAGADLNWMKKMKEYSREENYLDSLALAKMFETIDTIAKPVIGVGHGSILGGGTGLIASCDFVLASEETTFGFTEVMLGLVPAVISPFVVNKIGQSFARAYFMSGERFDAKIALNMGLVHELCPHEKIDEQLENKIKLFLKPGPQSQVAAKRLLRGVRDFSYEGDDKLRDFTCQTIASIRVGDEAQEGMSALLEKRSPHWRGEKS